MTILEQSGKAKKIKKTKQEKGRKMKLKQK